MFRVLTFIFYFIFSCTSCSAILTSLQLDNQTLTSWEDLEEDSSLWAYEAFLNTVSYSFVTPDVWACLEPYFLPNHHPIKRKLDRLFQKTRATQSLDLFEQAGFRGAEMRKPTNIAVGRRREASRF